MMWEFDESLDLVRHLGKVLVSKGWYVALAGGVLHRGGSDHDLDLVFIPHYGAKLEDLAFALIDEGWTRIRTVEQMRAGWANPDKKHVEEWAARSGRRVDVIILTTPDLEPRQKPVFGPAYYHE